ncbi:MAG: hypothetical protein QM661_08565 [Solimonas sp.]
MVFRCCVLIAGLLLSTAAAATPAAFDLTGPSLDVVVKRGGKILPVSEVPNLAVGDQLWIKPELPATQSAHYLTVAVFLRGATNPPPESWFFECKTWMDPCAHSGLDITVPEGAQQVLVFMAPETGGDLQTLISAVRGRPGAFVRASQDLNQAALDRSRLDRYIDAVRYLSTHDPYKIKDTAPLLARSLAIKVDDKCLDKIPELQAPCLMQGQEALILNDGHSTSIVEALANGPGADLVLAASATPEAGYGYYSPYISSIVDIARIFDSFHTASYQYIPALSSHDGSRLKLTLNAAPSFHNPKSVLVIALPAVEQAQLPPLHAVDPNEIYCANRTSLILPVEGAPLAFSTDYAHNITLAVTGDDGQTIYLPAKADGTQGGYVVDTSNLRGAALGDTVRASLQGYWGFEPYQGPGFQLRNAHTKSLSLADSDDNTLYVGRQEVIHLQADSVNCVDTIMLKDPAGKELQAEWKVVAPHTVEVKLPLQDASPGAMTLLVSQYGVNQPQPIALQAYLNAGRFDGFTIHAGDAHGVLSGNRLDLVTGLTLGSVSFSPGELSTDKGMDRLVMTTTDTQGAATFAAGSTVPARLALKDGRVVRLDVTVDAARPQLTLIGKSVQASRTSSDSHIELVGTKQLPQDARLTFSVRAKIPTAFTRDQTIEIAAADQSFSTTLSVAGGGIRLENAKVAVATLDPAQTFGASAFGPLQFRTVVNGTASDWQSLATLVRLPALKELTCPATPELACKLDGSDLFLIDSVAGDASFSHPAQVPDGFTETTMLVPRPVDGHLYVRLRDDPSAISAVTLPVQELPPTPEEQARAAAAKAAAEKASSPSSSDPPAATTTPTSPQPTQPVR